MKELTRNSRSSNTKISGITTQNLCLNYDQGQTALTDVNLEIAMGEKVGLIGANGAGKTSLFMSICGVFTPSLGNIKILGQTMSPGEFNPNIGLVFQNPEDQLFCPTVRDDVAFGPENMGLSPEEVTERVEMALALTEVSHLLERAPHHLSGGEKCMVAIASVLAMQPQVILYDEPSANLDLKARRRLIKFLQTSQETIFVSSHDLELLIEVCDRVILLNQGRVIADGKTSIIMSDKSLMEANNLEVPHSLTHYHP